MRIFLFAAAILSGPAGASATEPAEASRPAAATDEPVEQASGGTYRLPGPNDVKATAVVFIGHDCPTSNGYAPEIGRLTEEFGPKEVAFCVVYADADLSRTDARRHAADYGFPCPALLDPRQSLARRFKATIKPETVLLGSGGDLLYRGRIDDRYADFGKRRAVPTRREFRDVLEAVVAGRPVPVDRAEAIGCDIDFRGRE